MAEEDNIYHITLMRHAESTGNAEHRVQGQMEYPLSEKGCAQAAALAQRWLTEGVRFDRVIVSPQERAHHTGQIIAEALNAPIEPDPLWIERNNGIMAGKREEELRSLYKENDFTSPYHPVGETGEGDWPLYLRAGQALYHLLKRPAGKYLVVSHGGTLNAALYAILGIAPQANYQGPRFRFENTAFAKFRYYPMKHRWRIDIIGDRAHWKED
jgi:broad specificity phosphatase PhoE